MLRRLIFLLGLFPFVALGAEPLSYPDLVPGGEANIGLAPHWLRKRAPNSTIHEIIDLFRTHCGTIAAAPTTAERKAAIATLTDGVRRFAQAHPLGNAWTGSLAYWMPAEAGVGAALALQIAPGMLAATEMLRRGDPKRTRIARSHRDYPLLEALDRRAPFQPVWLNAEVEVVGVSQDASCNVLVRFTRVFLDRGP
ncbi:MAG: hypothetical protein ACOYK7_16000 [Pirellulales bacterium]